MIDWAGVNAQRAGTLLMQLPKFHPQTHRTSKYSFQYLDTEHLRIYNDLLAHKLHK